MAGTLAMQRIEVALLAAMASLALLLSSVGIFALVAIYRVRIVRLESSSPTIAKLTAPQIAKCPLI